MTADLLRRAAVKLRGHAGAATPGPWKVDDETYAETIYAADGFTAVVAGGRWGGEASVFNETADAAFIALLGPPVARALAELLDHIADDVSDAGDRTEPGGLVRNEYGSIRFDWTAAVKLARAILREEES